MALINRMSRLFTADVHAVLDRIEEPEALLRQAIRDMEEELARSEQRIRSLEREHDSLAARARRIEASRAGLDEQLDVCFGAQNDGLARKLVRRKLEAGRLAEQLAGRRDATDKALAEARTSLCERREQLDGMRQKAELFADGAQAAASPACEHERWGQGDFTVGDDEVEVAFLREKQRRAGA